MNVSVFPSEKSPHLLQCTPITLLTNEDLHLSQWKYSRKAVNVEFLKYFIVRWGVIKKQNKTIKQKASTKKVKTGTYKRLCCLDVCRQRELQIGTTENNNKKQQHIDDVLASLKGQHSFMVKDNLSIQQQRLMRV